MDDSMERTFDDCLNSIDSLTWKYDLPDEIEVRIDDIVDQTEENQIDELATRIKSLISLVYYFEEEINNSGKKHQTVKNLADYLNIVIKDLYNLED